MRQLRPALRLHGLTEQQWRVLGELLDVDEIAASDLASATCLRASSLSRIIKDLEGRHYLTRRSQIEDLRRTMISIAPRGRALMQQLVPATRELTEMVAERFGRERLDTLIDLSVDLDTSLGGPAPSEDDGE